MGRILEYPPASAYEYKCKLCHDFSNLIWHPPSMPLPSLQLSAKNGCAVCSLIVGLYGHYVNVDDPEGQSDVLEFEAEDGYGTGGQFRAFLKVKEGREKGRRWVVWAENTKYDRTGTPPWLQELKNYKYVHKRAKDADPKYIKERWQECKEQHASCNDRSERIRTSSAAIDMYKPKRLLCISDFATTGRPVLTTADGKMWSQDVSYSALSYCGTVPESLHLNRANMESWQSEPLALSLSKTCREAIEVANQLGIDYIWIDALCVLQDDPEERLEVRAHMASIYHNAELVLGAADSHLDGLFIPATTVYETPIQHGETISNVLIRETLRKDFTYPLHEDPWGHHQLIVARRSIQFTREGIYWRCPHTNLMNTCTRAESAQELHAHAHMTSLITVPKMQEGLTAKALIGAWCKAAQYGGPLPSNNPGELLSVLSGFCKYVEVAEVSLGRYCAGLWEKHLPVGLLWYAGWYRKVEKPPKNGEIKLLQPSWSWISLQGPRPHWPYEGLYEMEPSAKIVAVSTRLSTKDPHGPVEGGQLTIQGDLYAVRLNPCGQYGVDDERKDPVRFVDDEGSNRPGFMKSLSCFRSHQKKIPYEWKFNNDHPMTPDLYGYKTKDIRYFLVISTSRKQRRPNGDKWVYSTQYHGIFLRELPYLELQEQPYSVDFPAKMGVYNRIGYGMVTVEGQLGPLKQKCTNETIMII